MNSKINHLSIGETGVSVRAYNILRRAGLDNIGDVVKMTDKELLAIKYLGVKSLADIKKEIFDENRVLEEIKSRKMPSKAESSSKAEERIYSAEEDKAYNALLAEPKGKLWRRSD